MSYSIETLIKHGCKLGMMLVSSEEGFRDLADGESMVLLGPMDDVSLNTRFSFKAAISDEECWGVFYYVQKAAFEAVEAADSRFSAMLGSFKDVSDLVDGDTREKVRAALTERTLYELDYEAIFKEAVCLRESKALADSLPQCGTIASSTGGRL